jgi:5-methylcytosine-specific restriction endonuclease McrA
MGPTIDHIVPLSISRDDTRTNVHLAHWLCNGRKTNRGGGEQLLLIG